MLQAVTEPPCGILYTVMSDSTVEIETHNPE